MAFRRFATMLASQAVSQIRNCTSRISFKSLPFATIFGLCGLDSEMEMPRVLFLITEDWYFWSHRRLLAQHLLQEGYRVDVVTSTGRYYDRIKAAGIHHHSVGLNRQSKNPLREALTIYQLVRLFSRLRPDIVHAVGMKPMLYGSLAARIAHVPAIVCAVAGLGWLFSKGGAIKTMARAAVSAYFRGFLHNRDDCRFLVQNAHHRDLLIRSKIAADSQITQVAGAGVDIERFCYTPEPDGPPTIVTHARMLRDKGIEDLVQAARVLKQEHVDCRFLLVGDPDAANPTSIPKEQLRAWTHEGIIQWQSRRNDIPQLLASSHIACLPSYHEGFPLALVEAAACGRPIVTTNIPGCRDVVADGQSGILVPPRDVPALVTALRRLINDAGLRRSMGRLGRLRVECNMSSTTVNNETVACYERVLNRVEKPHQKQLPTNLAEAARTNEDPIGLSHGKDMLTCEY